MIRFFALTAALPAVLIAASLGFAAPAFAEEGARQPIKIEGQHRQHKKGGMMSPEDVAKIESMTAEEREAFLKDKRAAWEKMTDEERAAARADVKAKFDAMTPEEKEALKALQQKIGEKMRAEYQKKLETMTPEEKDAYLEKVKSRKERMEQDFERMTPEQQEKFKQRLERRRGKMQQDRVSPME